MGIVSGLRFLSPLAVLGMSVPQVMFATECNVTEYFPYNYLPQNVCIITKCTFQSVNFTKAGTVPFPAFQYLPIMLKFGCYFGKLV